MGKDAGEMQALQGRLRGGGGESEWEKGAQVPQGGMPLGAERGGGGREYRGDFVGAGGGRPTRKDEG
jgi:hypothetical protein